jgi:hypothetical protein
VEHIYQSFAILPSEFINRNRSNPLISTDYLLSDKLHFQVDNQVINKNVWSCQVNVSGKEFKVLLGDCGTTDFYEFAMVVCSKELPTWGLYLVFDDSVNVEDKEAMIACSVPNDTNDSWLEASTFLQASFLAGMEQLRDAGLAWNKPTEYKEEFQRLLSFIKFHTAVYEVQDEGQEEGL